MMDYLTSEKYTHLDAVNDVGEWSMDDIKVRRLYYNNYNNCIVNFNYGVGCIA